MPKIVWLDQNKVMEVPIPQRGFMSLGRGKDNDIALSDPQVNRRHARLVCGPHGCLLKDLKSGKNLLVNGDSVNSRFLQNGDIIRIGNHVLEYLAENGPHAITGAGGVNFRLGREHLKKQTEVPETSDERAFLRYMSGPAQGHIQTIDRPLLPIGDPDGYYAAVSRRTNGYYLLNLGKGMHVRLNGEPVSGAGIGLESGDVITLGNERIEIRIFEQATH